MADEGIVVDTWGWLALADDREPKHTAVRDLLVGFWKTRGVTVTTDYILDETFTLVFRRLAFVKARRFVSVIDESEREGSLRIERIGAERFARAKTLRLRYRDKPLISFTDLTTMVVMQDTRIIQIVTDDAHFAHVGLGFERLP